MRYLPRLAGEELHDLLRAFPAVLIVGPRQAGTLARHALPGWRHLDLERPLDCAAVTADIEGLLVANPRLLVIDEAQRLPELFPALRHPIDRGRGRGAVRPARFCRPGSPEGCLRVAGWPRRDAGADAVSSGRAGRDAVPGGPVVLGRVRSGHLMRDATARVEWLGAYVSTLLERDLPALGVGLPARWLRPLWAVSEACIGSVSRNGGLALLGSLLPWTGMECDALEFLVTSWCCLPGCVVQMSGKD